MADPQFTGLPLDMQADYVANERRRKMSEALMLQSLKGQQGVQAGRFYVPPSPLSAVAQALQGYMGAKGQADADTGNAEIGKRYQGLMADEVKKYVDAGAGTPGSSETIMDEQANGGEGAVATINAPARPPMDAKTRITQAMVSQNPMLRAIGAKDYEALLKSAPGNMLGKIDPKDYTPESFAAFMAGGGAAVLKPRAKMEAGADGVYRDPYNIPPNTVVNDPNKPFSAPTTPGGGPVPNTVFQDYEKARQTAGAPNVSVNTADNPFLRGLGEASAKAFETGATQARGALDTINTVHQIRGALDTSGLQLGPGTSVQMLFNRIGEKFVGATADEKTRMAKGREIVQGLAQLELDAAKQMKGQGTITESEREIIRRAGSGDIDKVSNSEMNSLMTALEKVSRNKIKAHTGQLDGLRKQKNISPMVLAPFDIKMPPEYAPPGNASPAGRPALSPETQQLLDKFAPEQ